LEIIQYLVTCGTSLSDKDEAGATPLHYAVKNPEHLQILLDNGAPINAQVKKHFYQITDFLLGQRMSYSFTFSDNSRTSRKSQDIDSTWCRYGN
jgi:ankyrin repeat protein